MSRRKQSHPKPFKRLSDDEDDEANMKTSATSDTEGVKPQLDSSTDETFLRSPKVVKSEPASPDVIKAEEREAIQEDKPPVIFLNDVLLLRKVEKDEAHQTGRSFLVCAAIPLPKGSSIGPFDAEIVSLSSIRQGDMVLQAQEENGETSFVRVDDPHATWLTMLRPAPSESVRNTSVLYKGGQIWCEIISELKLGAELLSSFTIQDSTKSEPCSPDSTEYKEKEDESDMDIKTEVQSTPSLIPSPLVAPNNIVNHAALLYGCPFCGVRFSSARTLEGHLTYYCSKKPSNATTGNDTRQDLSEENEDRKQQTPNINNPSDEENEKHNNDSCEDAIDTDESDSKLLKSDEVFHCPFCSYKSDKLSSLNRHKRIHGRGNSSPTSSTSSISPVSKQECYCAECNIQFSSFSTFKCHKEFYCSKRIDGNVMASSPDKSGILNKKNFPNLSFHEQMSPTATKNLKQFMNVSSNSIISGQTNVILAPPIVARGILNIPFGMPTVIVQPVVPPSPGPISPANTPSNKTKSTTEHQVDLPLDLSVGRKQISCDDSDKENNLCPKNIDTTKRESVKKETNSKSNSPAFSSPSSSPVQRSRSTSGHSEEKTPSPVPSASNRISPFIVQPNAQFIGGKPIPPLPHSVSKCVDCNIVFYKHENFIIHKKHYCSSRQAHSDLNDSVDDESRDSGDVSTEIKDKRIIIQTDKPNSPEKTNSDSDSSSSPPNLESNSKETHQNGTKTGDIISNKTSLNDLTIQYFCKPCNIRFSSKSTITAHKEFYCPYAQDINRGLTKNVNGVSLADKCVDNGESTAKCDRCGTTFPSMKLLRLHYCTGVATQVPLLRCPYCDYVTQTENRISEHLKVHMPSKAYRCTLCGYRGNTVRGMRMHGKMHIDNGEEFSDEHMVEIEEPPLVPVMFNNPNETASTNVEAELIRLKNEPYKRRRSRKSYEKSEHMSNIRESSKSVCVFCGQPFSDNASLAMHIRIHEMVAYHAVSSRNLKCHFCEYVAETFPSLMVHVEHKHLKDAGRDKSQDIEQKSPEDSSPKRRSFEVDDEPLFSPKRSRLASSSPEPRKSPKVHKAEHSPSNTRHDAEKERTLDLLKLKGKIKIEPMESKCEDDVSTQKENINNNEVSRKRRHSSTESSSDKSRPRSESPSDKISLNNGIKDEKVNGNDEVLSPLRSPVLSPELARYYQLAMQVMPPLIVPRVPCRPSPSERTEKLQPSAKYCKYCDISFTYLSTYVAHKKYYCTARQTEEMTPPTKA